LWDAFAMAIDQGPPMNPDHDRLPGPIDKAIAVSLDRQHAGPLVRVRRLVDWPTRFFLIDHDLAGGIHDDLRLVASENDGAGDANRLAVKIFLWLVDSYFAELGNGRLGNEDREVVRRRIIGCRIQIAIAIAAARFDLHFDRDLLIDFAGRFDWR